MADRRDDLDSWLSRRVDPLPPPPGTFELIKRRARRRKYRRLAFTATAAAVIVAAAVTVPQVVNLPVNQPAVSAQGAGGNHLSVTPSGGGGASQSSSSSSAAPPTSTAAAAPVPADFRPSSVTFIGTRTGWVIGQASTPGHCATPYCTSVARTDDAGRTWTGVPAPVTGAPDGGTGVSQVRFLNADDGWAFGPSLFATRDGGRHWTQVATGGRRVISLETVGSRVFGLFASCTGGGTAFATGCTSFTLQEAPAAAGGAWAPVGPATSGLAGQAASLVLTASRGYLLGPDGTLYAGPADGSGGWQRAGTLPPGCTVGTALGDGQPTGALLAAVTAAHLVLACTSAEPGRADQQKLIYTSANGGASWQQGPRAPDPGVAFSLAASPARAVVLGTDRGIDVLPAGGTAWQAAALDAAVPSGGFGYVGMTTDRQGVALPADPAAGTVWFSYDGGQTWAPSTVS